MKILRIFFSKISLLGQETLDMRVFIYLTGSRDCKDLKKIYVGMLFSGYLKLGVLGAWMTFKKAEMAKTLKNGLSMIEMNPLNHNWLDFVILLGLTLHQFQKKTAVKYLFNKV